MESRHFMTGQKNICCERAKRRDGLPVVNTSFNLDFWTGWLAIDDFVNTLYVDQR